MDAQEPTTNKRTRKKTPWFIGLAVVVSQLGVGYKTDQNVQTKIDSFQAELAQVRLETEQAFSKKTDNDAVLQKLDALQKQVGQIEASVSGIHGYLRARNRGQYGYRINDEGGPPGS